MQAMGFSMLATEQPKYLPPPDSPTSRNQFFSKASLTAKQSTTVRITQTDQNDLQCNERSPSKLNRNPSARLCMNILEPPPKQSPSIQPSKTDLLQTNTRFYFFQISLVDRYAILDTFLPTSNALQSPQIFNKQRAPNTDPLTHSPTPPNSLPTQENDQNSDSEPQSPNLQKLNNHPPLQHPQSK